MPRVTCLGCGVFLSAFLSHSALADDCKREANTTVERASCQETRLKTDQAMLTMEMKHARLLARRADGSIWISLHGLGPNIEKAGGDWAIYVKAQCGLEDSFVPGSGIAFAAPACLADRTETRIAELRDFNNELSTMLDQ